MAQNQDQKNSGFMNKITNTAKESFDAVHDTMDTIGDATSRTAKKATQKVSDTVNSVRNDRD
jgi:gas vesicle protein